jgi:hypothetical protein
MVATATDLLFEELVAYWSIIAFSFLFHGKLLMFGLLDVFEFCNHEQLVPLSANSLPQAYPPQKNQENFPNLQRKIKFLT